MTQRFSPLPILSGHLWAMRAKGQARMPKADLFWFAGFPLLVGILMGLGVGLGLDIRDGSSQLLSATALFVGAMLSVFVFLSNLRIKVTDDQTLAYRRRLKQLISGTVASTLYVALLAMAAAVALVAVATLQFLRTPGFAPFTVGVVAALGTHLGVNVLAVIRRMFGVYQEVFGVDYGADLEAVADPRPADRPKTG